MVENVNETMLLPQHKSKKQSYAAGLVLHVCKGRFDERKRCPALWDARKGSHDHLILLAGRPSHGFAV
ncbi:hypothetical protein BWQ96_04100 [Gracilariopsis chorda]|uniref:Uncharacterized protein n=1 Tax=Gracilariopsis chorda TaxID=448386 RepID=A0A2V3IVD9_9FLOR|nr:hypothetical protein BWQ96_04100 [Gracilariopsis chorda]|eukprot:PXF46094.1 hypothetical protein BWQ96_04100 [Gracilariopsis chorda]